MKKLELKQMEVVDGGTSIEGCAGAGTAVAVSALIIASGVATGGITIAIGALVGSWFGAGVFGACIHLS